MPNDITLDQVRRMAADAGLTHYTEEHLQQLLRATKIAQSRRAALALVAEVAETNLVITVAKAVPTHVDVGSSHRNLVHSTQKFLGHC